MRKNGICAIGIIQGKERLNYGTLFRTAQIFEADFVFVVGARYQPQKTDTYCSYRHLPSYSYQNFADFLRHRPYDCSLVSVELCSDAVCLSQFTHPKRAIYLLGSEDYGLPPEILKASDLKVAIHGERSLNVAVAGSILLYDRVCKRSLG
jgi:tRNA G18 (ribose-2'-O)-methylase SpoU